MVRSARPDDALRRERVTTQAKGSKGAWHLQKSPEYRIRAHYGIVCNAEFREKVPGT